jgi:prevent-host-death family protein
MDSKTTISATEARKNFFKIIKDVGKTGASYTLTVNGRPAVIMMDADEFDSWEETREIMSDPELMRDIREGEKEIAEGKGIPFEKVVAEIRSERR